MAKIIFVHGWGFDPTFWEPLRHEFAQYSTHAVDMGFFGYQSFEDQPYVYVTHSMGLSWVLENVKHPTAIIAINGFTKFIESADWSAGVSRLTLKRMMKGFRVSPQFVWEDLMTKAGMPACTYPDCANEERLLDGLRSLEKGDNRAKWATLECPKLVISSARDEIVPQKLTQASFKGDQICYIEGDHILPLSRTKKVATAMKRFLDELNIE